MSTIRAGAGELNQMVVHMNRAYWLVTSALLRRLGLYAGQELLLMQLWDQDGQSQADLAKALKLDPSTVTRTVRSLEQQGLLARTPSPVDRRATIVSLTDGGRALREKVESTWSELEGILTQGMSQRQRDDLLRLLRRVENNLTAAGETLRLDN
ncbi:MarR family winged helix-turn-helix transcriptional regulator [Nocardia sp. NPDC059240]|uniref:MarR family winged helix-turn-helix transcriptional regulator n=1 Tax=Nocardia sp. NPDC059240 TaxID=3346786 RepID=UPI003687494C